ncbi:hypothetical protein [Actinokineospora sp. HUAS TT18]|uniref:hypothetical protein n=1 Tax=Actinokineospora sp. HUAS TT18 TaxID=3447451 RepID=UPI003F5263FD
MTLRAAFREYLLGGAVQRGTQLAVALAERFPAEADLVEWLVVNGPGWYECRAGAFAGRLVHVGPWPPEAELGALWMDSLELSIMRLLPGQWFALDPVPLFRYGAFSTWLTLIRACSTAR